MLGSVSSLTCQLHPNGRNKGPLHYCLFNNMTEKINWNFDTQTGEQDASYLINAYIHLLEGHNRCEVLIQKALEDRNHKIAQPSEKNSGPFIATIINQRLPTRKNLNRSCKDLEKFSMLIPKSPSSTFQFYQKKPKLKWPSSDLPELPEDNWLPGVTQLN